MRGERGRWVRVIGLLGVGVVIGWAVPSQEAAGAKEKKVRPPRVGYVNVAKVLRDFQWANQEGAQITKRRGEYASKLGEKRDAVAALRQRHERANDAASRRELKAQMDAGEAAIKDLDSEAKRELTEASNATIVKVYHQIKAVVGELAEERGLDVVEAFPSATRAEDDKSPQVAQLMLQTPALMPFYLKSELDISQDVIDRLNKKYPATGN